MSLGVFHLRDALGSACGSDTMTHLGGETSRWGSEKNRTRVKKSEKKTSYRFEASSQKDKMLHGKKTNKDSDQDKGPKRSLQALSTEKRGKRNRPRQQRGKLARKQKGEGT